MKNLGTDTRNESYRNCEKTTMRQKVFSVIAKHQPISDYEIAGILGMTINSITGRRHELVEQGLVVDGGKVKQNGRTVHVWETTNQMRLI